MKRRFIWLMQPLNLALTLLALVPLYLVHVFMQAFKANFPRNDQAWSQVDVAVAAVDGTLTLDLLLEPFGGHLLLLPNLQTALSAWATRWNLNTDMYTIFGLRVIVVALLVALVYRTHPRLAPYVPLPLTILLFPVQMDFMWVIPLMTNWVYPEVLTLIGLALLTAGFGRRPWLVTALCGLLAAVATLSNGSGIAVFGVLLVAIVIRSARRWWFPVLWVVLAVAMLFVYISLAGVAVSTEAERDGFVVSLENLIDLPGFVLAFAGANFIADWDRYTEAVWLGLLGVALLGVNFAYLWYKAPERFRELLATWLPVALYTPASAFLIGMNRISAYGSVDIVFHKHYKAATAVSWAALAVLMAMSFDAFRRTDAPTWKDRGPALANALVIPLLAGLFVISNYMVVQTPTWDAKRLTEFCHWRFMYTQNAFETIPGVVDQGCLWDGTHLHDLSVRRMAMFADHAPSNLLPEKYQPGTPVLVESDMPWPVIHIRDWLLHGVDPADVVFIAPDPPTSPRTEPDLPPNLVLTNHSDDPVAEATALLGDNPDTLWYVRRADVESALPSLFDDLFAENTLAFDLTYVAEGDTEFTITRYTRVDPAAEPLLIFDDTLALVAWPDGEATACEPLEIQTLWRADDPIEMGYGYSITHVLVNDAGEVVTRSDGQLGYIETHLWEPGTLYLDEHTLQVPCDLPDGDYSLQAGVYDYADGERLPVAPADGTEPGLGVVGAVQP